MRNSTSRLVFIFIAMIIVTADARIKSRDLKKTDKVEYTTPNTEAGIETTKSLDTPERKLSDSSYSFSHGYHGAAKNNALFWRNKNSRKLEEIPELISQHNTEDVTETTKYWDTKEKRELHDYSSYSSSYGYRGEAKNNALFWRKKNSRNLKKDPQVIVQLAKVNFAEPKDSVGRDEDRELSTGRYHSSASSDSHSYRYHEKSKNGDKYKGSSLRSNDRYNSSSSHSSSYGYHGTAKNNALFWRKKNSD